MTNGLDRLERLFSKKKNGAATREQPAGKPDFITYNSTSLRFRKGTAVGGPLPYPTRVSPLDDMHFPQPSFIRPKAARMVPRDDRAKPAQGHVPLSRPGTANRSSSIYEPSFSLPPRPSTATSPTTLSPKNEPRVCATRSPQGPPASYTVQSRSMTVATSPKRRTFSSQRSSGMTNFSNDGTYSTYSGYCTSTSLSSSGSSMMSASTSTSHGSTCSTLVRPSFHAESLYEISVMATGLTLESDSCTKQSPSLLQRRDVFLPPLCNLDTYLLQSHRDSSAITVSSGEVSPATIVQSTPLCSSSLPKDEIQNEESEDKIQDGELHDFEGLADKPPTTPKAAYEATVSPKDSSEKNTVEEEAEQQNDESRSEEKPIEAVPAKDQSTLNETPVLRRDSVFASIAMPQVRPKSPTVSTRRRSRNPRHPVLLRYQRHLPMAPKPTSPNSVLMEPDLSDFLLLGDDDIAEDVPALIAAAAVANEADSTSGNEGLVESETVDTACTSSADDAAPTNPPKTPPKTPNRTKKADALQKPLPSTPANSTPPMTASTPISPASALRRRALAVATAPVSQPPTFKALPPSFHSRLPDMRLLSSPMSFALPPLPATANGRLRTPAGEARMAAAFEIARIASQYKFDLAYVATVWPKNMATSQPNLGSAAAPTSCTGHMSKLSQASDSTFTSASTSSSAVRCVSVSPLKQRKSKLESHFLAAFGLATVRAPYNLSAPTHAKVLNNERWLEISEADAKAGGFSHGYGCAFYRGRSAVTPTTTGSPPGTLLSQRCYHRRPSTSDCDADTEQDGRTTPRPVRRSSRKASVSSAAVEKGNNSGIVFVAYRRKEVADERQHQGMKDDLEALYRDVDALVNKILDVHVEKQCLA
ncbi:hypothetical protein SEPCBS119000_004384 [Sporothrix epigloea]|uniref:Uncharacterized protein n=1 Tax=Sporothrix epigloea TaxID=1892477 RepID=A0ABP0DTM9_9PEZI